jgi:hypothetical protein
MVFDEQQRALRPMLGVAGAAYLGEAVAAGFDLAGVAPDGSAALAVSQGRLYLVGGLRSMPAPPVAIENAIENVDRIAWSLDGSGAAVYSSASGRAQFLRTLGQAPAAGDVQDLAGLPGTVSALAVDAAGQRLLVGVAAEEGGGVYLVASGEGARRIAEAARPSSLVLARGGSDLFFADRERSQIWEVRNFATEAAVMLFADSLPEPVAVQLSADHRRLLAAGAESRALAVFDIETRAAVAQIALDFTPTALEPFGEKSLWRLNAAGQEGDPLYVLADTAGQDPSVYFVPAGREQ